MVKKLPIGLRWFMLFLSIYLPAYSPAHAQPSADIFELNYFIADGQVTLSWLNFEELNALDSAELAEYIFGIEAFKVQLGDSPGALATIQTLPAGEAASESLDITGELEAGQTRYAQVVIQFSDGTSQAAGDTPLLIYLMPSLGELEIAQIESGRYALSWTALPNNIPNFGYYLLEFGNSFGGLQIDTLYNAGLSEYELDLLSDGAVTEFTLTVLDTEEQVHSSASTSFQTEDQLPPPLPSITSFERDFRDLFAELEVTADLDEYGDFNSLSVYAAFGNPCANTEDYSNCVATLPTDTLAFSTEDPFAEQAFMTMPDGEYTFFLEVADDAGNIARLDTAFYFEVLDDVPPLAPIINQIIAKDSQLNVSWSVNIGSELGYNDVAAFEISIYSLDFSTSFGEYIPSGNATSISFEDAQFFIPNKDLLLDLIAIDSAGNRSPVATRTFRMSAGENENNDFFSTATYIESPTADFFGVERFFESSLMLGELASDEEDIYAFDVEEGVEYELILASFGLNDEPLNEGTLDIFFEEDTVQVALTEELAGNRMVLKYESDYDGIAYARVSGRNSLSATGGYQIKLFHNAELFGGQFGKHGGRNRADAPNIIGVADYIGFTAANDFFGSFNGRLVSSVYPVATKKFYRIQVGEPDSTEAPRCELPFWCSDELPTKAIGSQLEWLIESRANIKVGLEDAEGNVLRTWDSHETEAGRTDGEPTYSETVIYTFNEPGVYYIFIAASNLNPTATGGLRMSAPVFKPPYEVKGGINELSYGSQGGTAYAPVPYVEFRMPDGPMDKPFFLGLTVGDTTYVSELIDPSSYRLDSLTENYYYLLTSDIEAFNAVYGGEPSIPEPSSEMPDLQFLSPEGGVMYLETEDFEPIDELEYGALAGESWPAAFEGNRGTIELIDADPATLEVEVAPNFRPENWQVSLRQNGTPFKANSKPSSYRMDAHEPNPNFSTPSFLVHDMEDSLTLSNALSSNLADTVDWYRIQAMPGDTALITLTSRGVNFLPRVSLYETDSTNSSMVSNGGIIASIKDSVMKPFDAKVEYELIIPENKENPNNIFDIWIRVSSQTQGEGIYSLEFKRAYKPETIGWSENFDNSFEEALPPRWSVFSRDGNTNEWQPTSDLEEEESIAAGVFFNKLQSDDWLASPVLHIEERAEFVFDTRAVALIEVDRDFSETYEVWVGDAAARENPEDYTDRVLVSTTNSTEFEQVVVDLKGYIGQDIRVAIRNVSENANLQLVDNAELRAAPDYGTVFGTVVSAENDEPLEGVSIKIGELEATTDSQGQFRIIDVMAQTQELAASLNGYQEASFNFVVEDMAEDTLNVSLLTELPQETVYFTELEEGQDPGSTSSWERSTSIIYDGMEVTPFRSYMLLFGGKEGYPAEEYVRSWESRTFDLSGYKEAKLRFKLNQFTNDGDGLKVYKRGEQVLPTFFDTQGDSITDDATVRSDNTEGWETVELDISALADELLGNNLRLGFAFESHDTTAIGFGVAIDSIQVVATPINLPTTVTDLQAACAAPGQVTLTWSAEEGIQYQVMRSHIFQRSFELIGEVAQGTFTDENVEDGEQYTYFVQAVGISGKGRPSNEVSAHPRAVQYVDIAGEERYAEDFEDIELGELPSGWSVEVVQRDKYLFEVGNSARSSDDFVVYPENGKFLYTTATLENEEMQVGATGILVSPWIDASETITANLLLRYEAISTAQSQQYYLGIKTACDAEWQFIDTLKNAADWTSFEYNLKEYSLEGEPRFRVGFVIEHRRRTDLVDQNRFGIDNVVIGEFDYATLSGRVSNPTGEAVPGAAVFVGKREPVYTDAEGLYFIDSTATIFEETEETIEVVGWYHTDTSSIENITLRPGMAGVDFVLEPALPQIKEKAIAFEQDGSPIISWEKALPPGQHHLHDSAWEEQLSDETMWYAFDLSSPAIDMSYWLEKVGLHLLPRSSNARAEVKVLGRSATGQPDWNQVYAEKTIAVMEESSYSVEVNAVVPERVFVAVKVSESSLLLDYSQPSNAYSSGNGETWTPAQTNGGAMLDMHAGTGIEFLQEYEVYSGEQPGELSLIGTTSEPFYLDTTVNIGEQRYYRVAGKYNVGLSPRSEPVLYNLDTLAWLEMEEEPITVELPINQMDSTYELEVSNRGQDPLDYEVVFEANIPNGRVAGSRMYSYNSLEAGTTKTIHIGLVHGGNDTESIRYASVQFPEGISVTQSTIFEVPENGRYLVSNGATGQEVQWFSPTGIDGVGPIKSGAVAYTHLTVEIADDFEGLPYFDYTIIGDGRGEGERQTTGRYQMEGLPISVNGSTGSIAPDATQLIPINIDVNESKPGTYRGRLFILSNDANQALRLRPFDVSIAPAQAAAQITLASSQGGAPIQGAVVSAEGRRAVSDENGVVDFPSLPVGLYRYKAYHPDYLAKEDTFTLSETGQLLQRSVSIVPNLPSPENIQVADSSNRMEVMWEFEANPVIALGFEGQAGEFGRAPWLTESGFWQYSDREAKLGNTSIAVRATAVGDTAVLLGPVFMANDQSEVSFWTKIGGEKGQANVGRLMLLAKLPSGQSRLIAEILVKEPEWAQHTFSLAEATEPNSQIVLAATTIQGSVLYIDDMQFNDETKLKEAERSASHLQLFRAVNGVEALLLDNIDLAASMYIDTQIEPDSSYSYRLKAVYNLGTSEFSERASSLLANIAPTIAPLEDAAIQEDASATRLLLGEDANGTALSFSAFSDTAAIELEVQGDTVIASPVPDWHGTATVSAVVSDGSLSDTTSFSLLVEAVNDAPRFTTTAPEEVNQGTEYIYEFAFEDPEGDESSFEIEELPTWMSLEDNSQALRGTPDNSHIGENSLVIMATDGQDTSRQRTAIQVLEFNYPAEFVSEPVITATESVEYQYTVTVSDRDGDELTVTAPLMPEWLSFDAESLLVSGTPQHQDVGAAEVTLSVTDGENVTEQSFSIAVKDTNQAPIFTSNPILTVLEGETYLYNVTASDPDGDPITLSAVNIPDWLSFSKNTGLLTGVPSSEDIGEHSVILKATDDLGMGKEQSYSLVVNNKNDAPVFTSTPVIEAIIEQAYIYAVTAADEDGDTVTIAAEEMPSWLTLEASGVDYAILSGIPYEEHLGDSLVSLTATDGKSEPAKQLFFLKVGRPTGLGNPELEGQILLYPNPAVDAVTVTLPASMGSQVQLWLFDATGAMVEAWKDVRLKDGQFSLPLDEPTGKYLLVMKADGQWAVKRLSIQR